MNQNKDMGNLKLTLLLYIVIFTMKLGVYYITGVMALLAEALHTMSDIIISAFLLIALMYSNKAPDKKHLYGHGRVQYVAALVAATLFISFTSFELYREGISRLTGHESVVYKNINLAVGVLVVSMIIAAAPLIKLFRQKMRGAAAKAQMLELVNDQLGHLAALGGTICVLWGFPLGDPISAMVVATIIALNAAGLLRENTSYLLGRSPRREIMIQIEEAALAVPGVQGIHDLRAEYVSPHVIHMDMHIQVSPALKINDGHAKANAVINAVKPFLGKNGFCNIHVDTKAQAHNYDPIPTSKEV